MGKPVQFYLRCDPAARYFYAVEIHDTRESMLRAIAEFKDSTYEDLKAEEPEAVCLRYVVKGNVKLRKKHDQIGTIFFVRNLTPMPTVIHELTHAAIGWARRSKVNLMKHSNLYAKCPEEKFVRTLQYLVEQYYERAPWPTTIKLRENTNHR